MAAASSADVVVNYRSRNNIHYVFSDRDELGPILQSLLGYAFKFLGASGEVRIRHERLHANRYDDRTDLVRVAIQVCGKGISEEMLQAISDSFQSMTELLDGKSHSQLDLNLSRCREFFRSTGGNLWIRAELQEGLFFHFSLPLAKEIEIKHRLRPGAVSRVKVVSEATPKLDASMKTEA